MIDFPYTDLQLEWLTLLETTELGKAEGRLREGECYCCLGLAAEFILKVVPVRTRVFYRFDGEISELTREMWEKLKLRGPLGNSMCDLISLASMNDRHRSFANIASVIKADPKLYFSNLDVENK